MDRAFLANHYGMLIVKAKNVFFFLRKTIIFFFMGKSTINCKYKTNFIIKKEMINYYFIIGYFNI